MSRLSVHLLFCALSACEPEGESTAPPLLPGASVSASAVTARVAAAPSDSAGPVSEIVPALRCGECHEKMYEEWITSGHHDAQRSPLYRALRKDAASEACDRCHAPLAALTPTNSPAARDGVSCEVCHRIEEAEVGDGPGFSLRASHDVKLGPLCDAKQPYFHRSECSPLFESAVLCGSCHTWVRSAAGGERVPVYTDYLDWQQSPFRGKSCQSCHMPGERASLASSEPERDDVPDHGFLGADRALRGTGVTVTAVVTRVGSRLRVAAQVQNARAGHHMPAGMSGRQLALRARSLSGAGGTVDEAESVFERRLVDAEGNEAPFYRAVRVAADTRLASRQSRAVTLEVGAQESGSLEISLVERRLSPALARSLGQSPEETTVHATTLALGPAGLPRSLSLPP